MKSYYRVNKNGSIDNRYKLAPKVKRNRFIKRLIIVELLAAGLLYMLVRATDYIASKIPDKVLISPIIENVEVKVENLIVNEPTYSMGSYEHIFDVVCNSNYEWDCSKAMAIIKCESNYNQYAIGVNANSTKDLGVWQINDIHGLSNADRFDIVKSTQVAYKLYQQRGNTFQAWTCNKVLTRDE